MPTSVEEVIKQLEDSGIIAPDTMASIRHGQVPSKDPQEFVRDLVKQGKVTDFQAQQICQGKTHSLALGNYIILEKIGAGGMGQVFKARHRRMDRIVAVKKLPASLTQDPGAIARFEREAKAAARLSHPNIVAAHDADEYGGIHFLVMEFVEGSDLSALVKKNGSQPVAKAVNYIVQAARGLDYAHKHGVVHRDIKPANLLLSSEGTIKVLDMGLALIEQGDGPAQAELTGTGALLGTVDYMAPEQALGTRRADARADIYSLGCSLYYLVAGKPTYDGDSLVAKLVAHRESPIPSLRDVRPDVPEQVDAVFCKMVAKKVEDRYQTMSDVVADLERCQDSLPTLSHVEPSTAAAPTKVRIGRVAAAENGSAPCPACGATIRLGEQARGKFGRCLRCQRWLAIAEDLGSVAELVPIVDDRTTCRTPDARTETLATRAEVAAKPLEEDGHQTAAISTEARAQELGKPPPKKEPRRRSIMVAAATLIVATAAALGVWSNRPRHVAPPPAEVVQAPTTAPPLSPTVVVPQFATIADQTITTTEPLMVVARVTNDPPAGEQWRFSLAAGGPPGMSIDPLTGVLTWPAGAQRAADKHAVTVRVQNTGAPRAERIASFVVTVTAGRKTDEPADPGRAAQPSNNGVGPTAPTAAKAPPAMPASVSGPGNATPEAPASPTAVGIFADEFAERIKDHLKHINDILSDRQRLMQAGTQILDDLDGIKRELAAVAAEKQVLQTQLVDVNTKISALSGRINLLSMYLQNPKNSGQGFEQELAQAQIGLQVALGEQSATAKNVTANQLLGTGLESQLVNALGKLDAHLRECKNLEEQWLPIADPFGKLTRREHEASIPKLSEWIAHDPNNDSANLMRGFAHDRCGEAPKAEADFSSAVQVNVGVKVLALGARGALRLRRGDRSGAEKDWQAAFLADNVAYDTELKSQRQRKAQQRDAIAAASKKRERYFYLLRGHAYCADKRWPQAKDQFKQAQQLDPRDPEAHRQIAVMHLTQRGASDSRDGAHERNALQEAKEACQLSNNKDWSCLLALAAAYAATGDFENAVSSGKQAVALAPGEHREFCKQQCLKIDARQVPDLEF